MHENSFHEVQKKSESHEEFQGPNFPLLDCAGKQVGHIDRITVSGDLLIVEGWVLAELVGWVNAEQKFECAPHLPRQDVLAHLGDVEFETPGFRLNVPVNRNHTVFWAEVDGMRYVYPLPKVE